MAEKKITWDDLAEDFVRACAYLAEAKLWWKEYYKDQDDFIKECEQVTKYFKGSKV